jgi:hypothetical protein
MRRDYKTKEKRKKTKEKNKIPKPSEDPFGAG